MPRMSKYDTGSVAVEPSSSPDLQTDVGEGHSGDADVLQQQTAVEERVEGAGHDDAPVRVVPTIEISVDGQTATVMLKNWKPGVSMAAVDRGIHLAMRDVQRYNHHLAFRRTDGVKDA